VITGQTNNDVDAANRGNHMNLKWDGFYDFSSDQERLSPSWQPEIYENHAIHCFEDLAFSKSISLLRSASTPTRATPARVGDPGAARKPTA
jgi:hypothetical protein